MNRFSSIATPCGGAKRVVVDLDPDGANGILGGQSPALGEPDRVAGMNPWS
jgi:hypothetical protein